MTLSVKTKNIKDEEVNFTGANYHEKYEDFSFNIKFDARKIHSFFNVIKTHSLKIEETKIIDNILKYKKYDFFTFYTCLISIVEMVRIYHEYANFFFREINIILTSFV